MNVLGLRTIRGQEPEHFVDACNSSPVPSESWNSTPLPDLARPFNTSVSLVPLGGLLGIEPERMDLDELLAGDV